MNASSEYKVFKPDLIVEATSVCDRAFPGCYAPNTVTNEDTVSLLKKNPQYFLNPKSLESHLAVIGKIDTIAIRGGEPSRHPALTELLEISLRFSNEVFLETHGRWIYPLTKGAQINRFLLDACGHLKVTMKLSFDRMHGLSASELQCITDTLERASIPWLVAITEIDHKTFSTTRAKCDWIPNSKIIFQKKAFKLTDLVTPTVGVIHCDGTLSSTLKSKYTFQIKQIRTTAI